jgi:hypothetical protein
MNSTVAVGGDRGLEKEKSELLETVTTISGSASVLSVPHLDEIVEKEDKDCHCCQEQGWTEQERRSRCVHQDQASSKDNFYISSQEHRSRDDQMWRRHGSRDGYGRQERYDEIGDCDSSSAAVSRVRSPLHHNSEEEKSLLVKDKKECKNDDMLLVNNQESSKANRSKCFNVPDTLLHTLDPLRSRRRCDDRVQRLQRWLLRAAFFMLILSLTLVFFQREKTSRARKSNNKYPPALAKGKRPSSKTAAAAAVLDANPFNISFLQPSTDGERTNPYLLDVASNETYGRFVNRTLAQAADNIEGRMLAACVTAYGINPIDSVGIGMMSVFEPSEKYYRAAGWLASPMVIQHGPAHIHAALVGRTVDGVVVAFRGTLGSSRGWQSYVDYLQSDALMYAYTSSEMGGKVYAGAYFSLQQLWSWNPEYMYWRCLVPWSQCNGGNSFSSATSRAARHNERRYLRGEIARQLKFAAAADKSTNTSTDPPPVKLYVTGHSKGGTMAILAAMKIHDRNYSNAKKSKSTTSIRGDGKSAAAAETQKWKGKRRSNPIPAGSSFIMPMSISHSQEEQDLRTITSASIGADSQAQSKTLPTAVYTFAAMKAGNLDFVRSLRATDIPVMQYENYLDLIPLLFPPTTAQMQFVQAKLNQQLPADDRPSTSSLDDTSGGSTSNNNRSNLLTLLQVMSFVSTHNPMHHTTGGTTNDGSIFGSLNNSPLGASMIPHHFGGSGAGKKQNEIPILASDNDEFHHVALPEQRLCMRYHKSNHSSEIMPCTAEVDGDRLRDIVQQLLVPAPTTEDEVKLSSSSTPNADLSSSAFSAKSHHKPSCKGMGYMHGVCGSVCGH